MLSSIVSYLHKSLSIRHKQEIQTASRILKNNKNIAIGDDCAAIADGDGYLLLAAEGILPELLESDPYFAGWSAIMVNVSDIYAMGGRPIAVVDTIWTQSLNESDLIWQGMQAASKVYNVPIVGGHTNCHSDYNALSVAILGRAQKIISSFSALSGDSLLLVSDFNGMVHPKYPFWDAFSNKEPHILQQNLEILRALAQDDFVDAGKDISMGGIVGTLLMFLETSNCGARLFLDRLSCPSILSLEQWLITFPSFGFLLSVRADKVSQVQARFHEQNLLCEEIGLITNTKKLCLEWEDQSIVFWDLNQENLTGFGL